MISILIFASQPSFLLCCYDSVLPLSLYLVYPLTTRNTIPYNIPTWALFVA